MDEYTKSVKCRYLFKFNQGHWSPSPVIAHQMCFQTGFAGLRPVGDVARSSGLNRYLPALFVAITSRQLYMQNVKFRFLNLNFMTSCASQ